jgi:hypothetical protein
MAAKSKSRNAQQERTGALLGALTNSASVRAANPVHWPTLVQTLMNVNAVLEFLADAARNRDGSLRANEVFEKYPNIRLNGRRETLAVASPIDEKGIEICSASRGIVPLLRENVDDARIPGRERNRPRFFGHALEPFQARGQEVIDRVCLTESRNFFGRLRTNDFCGSRFCWRTEHLEHKPFPVRIVVQNAIATRTIGRHVPLLF